MRRIFRIGLDQASPQQCIVPVISASGSVSSPAVQATITIMAPMISVMAAYLPRSEWCDQAGDEIAWQDGDGACWQEAGVIPVIIARRLAAPVISVVSGVVSPDVRGAITIAAPVISASGSILAPGIVPPAARVAVPVISASGSVSLPAIQTTITLAAPVISASGSVSAPNLSVEGQTIPGMIFVGTSVIPPAINGRISLAVPVITVGTSVAPPDADLGEGFAFEFVADHQTFTLSADHQSVYHVDLKQASWTAPRRPARPKEILL